MNYYEGPEIVAGRDRTERPGLASLMRALRSGLQRRQSEAASDAVRSEDEPIDLEFEQLTPAAPAIAFSEITEAWVRRQCAPMVFDAAFARFSADMAGEVSRSGREIVVEPNAVAPYGIRIWQENGRAAAACTCTLAEDGTPQTQHGPALCAHAVAALLAAIQQRGPAVAPTPLLCPVTRQPLLPGESAYACSQCQMAYSVEGWQFLVEFDKGRCCGCASRGTVTRISS